MPSTYSSLKFQLMATGENTLTWGDVTNTNLGTAIEEAIAESADVVFSGANVTLTLTDTNASQTARNLRLRLTGTTGAARDLIVPTIEKPYIVKNECADPITVKTSAGTGVAVQPGKTMWLYVDGNNVVGVVTQLETLVLGSALPVSSGGTGQIGFSNGEILIGSNVGNALTKTTLTAGTGVTITNGPGTITISSNPGSGTVTNVGGNGSVNGLTLTGSVTTSGNLTLGGALTGVNLQSQVTGVLPVGNGGTGATSLTGYIIGNGSGAFTASATIPGSAISGGFDASDVTSGTFSAARVGVTAQQTTNGYLSLPGGTIIQWGQVSRTNEGSVAASFPIAFPNACLSAQFTPVNSSADASFDVYGQIVSFTTSGITVYINRAGSESGTFSGYWLAIGY